MAVVEEIPPRADLPEVQEKKFEEPGTPTARKPGVTFKLSHDDVEEDASESKGEEFKRPKPYKSKLNNGWASLLTPKSILLLLILIKFLLRMTVIVVELVRAVTLTQPNLDQFPMTDPSSWPNFRSELIRHLSIQMIKIFVEDAIYFTIILKDLVLYWWITMSSLLVRLLGEKRAAAKWFDFFQLLIFVRSSVTFWTIKEYVLGAVSAILHAGMQYNMDHWPDLSISFFFALDFAAIGSIAAWKYWGDCRYFSYGAAMFVFLAHLIYLFMEPMYFILKVRYWSSLQPIKPQSYLHDQLLGLSKFCDFPIKNFYQIDSIKQDVMAFGYRTFSAILVNSTMANRLQDQAAIIVDAFPETAGSDDADQMLSAAIVQSIGHAMTGQALWYNGLGYGTMYAFATWILIEHALIRPIRFRHFGFTTSPIPPVCAALIVALAFLSIWQIMIVPISTLAKWQCVFEADSYAASLGFGQSLQKYLYVIQASSRSLSSSAFTTLKALYQDHTPFFLTRIKQLE